MPLMPKRVKHRKEQRGRIKGNASRGNRVVFGEYGLQSLDEGWISGRQIEAGRLGAAHYLGGEGKLYIRIFPHKPVTAKPLEVRMGSGKGEPEYWAAVVRPGTVLFEIAGGAAAGGARMPAPDRAQDAGQDAAGQAEDALMRLEELRAMPEAELREHVRKLREEIWQLRFKAATEPVTDPSAIRRARKEIARVLTVLRARELEALAAAAAALARGAPARAGGAGRAQRLRPAARKERGR
ncbi:MAG: hypothetical protein KatS3mg102_0978 [Planctomycetota bacterium]|nr:MAG: hypothetical protein KatS3mg102_0978 [Planctomycetota bacterium]